ncbi:7285_t:CDS:2, partial [Diversispora eburnea]
MKKDNYMEQSFQHKIDFLDITTNNKIDLPKTCEEVKENKIELDLQELSVICIIEDNSEEDIDNISEVTEEEKTFRKLFSH